ncbi:TonB-dependent receptor domain-containing protein [Undibacterium sp. TJN25]|uniref:TonB-dependent receptor domain-containing protein n=1 Tax=Undibacterium sp. TJN25 TaxID=3413056 RepID=UPI003BF38873
MSSNIIRDAVRAAFQVSGTALLTMAALPLHAQEAPVASPASVIAAPAADAGSGDVVIVTGRAGTGTRTKAKASYSITTINEETLRMQAPTSVTEAVKSVPGFWVEASGGEASGNIRARGIPVDGFGSVTLLEDGIPVQHDPSLGYLNADQAFRLDETIDRIEVVRGGPSSVFYTNAPAGAINFLSREIGETPSGLVKYTMGNYGLHRGDFWYSTPLANDWGIGIGGFYRQDDGIRSPGFTADKGGQIRLKLAKEVDHGRITADFKHLDDKVALFLGIPMMTNPDGSLSAVAGFNGNYGTVAGPQTQNVQMKMGNGSLYNFDNTEGTHVKRDQLSLKFDKDLWNDWKLNESMRYSKTDTQRNGVYPNQLQSISSFLAQSQPLLSNVPGATQLSLQPTYAPGTNYSNANGLMIVGGLRGVTMPLHEFINDTRLGRKFTIGEQTHDVTVGYYYAKFSQDFNRYSSTVLLGAESQAPLLDLVGSNAAGTRLGTVTDHGIYNYGYEWENASGKSTTNALYLSDEWQINDRLRIDGGVRHEQVNTAGRTEITQNVNLGTFATSKIRTGTGLFNYYDHTFKKDGWTLGANYQLEKNSGIFGRWTQAFRLPNLSSYITTPTAVPITQTMGLGEVGYKYAGTMMDFYPTLFYSKYNNVSYTNSVFNINNATVTPQTGYASSSTVGLELEGKIHPYTWGDLGFNLTLQQPKYKNLTYTDNVNNQPVVRDYTDNQLIRVPKVSYRLVPGLNLMGNQLRVQMSYEYEGERFVDSANSVRLPAYHTINMSAKYIASKSTSVFFYVDNLNNSLGLTEGNPRAGELQSADAGANAFLARPLLGRSIRAAVMYEF